MLLKKYGFGHSGLSMLIYVNFKNLQYIKTFRFER